MGINKRGVILLAVCLCTAANAQDSLKVSGALDDTLSLQQSVVTAKSREQQLREGAFAVNALNIRQLSGTLSSLSPALDRSSGIHFLQGEGVGRVTLPGLGIPVGGPAINRVPRQMMEQNLSAFYDGGLDVTISVPGGRELAQRTFNPKLGIVDGISIIGTSGIVRPFSNEAFVDAIRREIEVAVAIGVEHLVINSGAKSEAYLRARFPDLPPQAFVHYGNFIGETLKIAAEHHIPKVSMGIMVGKAVKLAEGHLDTHSKSVVMNKDFLKEVAEAAGCSPAAAAVIDRMTLARELWTALDEEDARRFFPALRDCCLRVCSSVYPPASGELTLLLVEE